MTTSVSVEDRLAITDLTIAYCWALDGHRWDELDHVFTVDATALLGRMCTGIDDIKARVAEALSPLDDSQHMVTNHQVTIDDDGVAGTSRCYFHAQHVRASATGGGGNFIVAGRYEDRVERTPDGWRIAARTLTTMWTEGNPAVVSGDG